MGRHLPILRRGAPLFALLAGLACAAPLAAQVEAPLRPVARPAGLSLPAAPVPAPQPDDPQALPAPPPVPDTAAAPLITVAPAAQTNCPDAPAGVTLGPETCLPLPRFVSLKSDEGNARRGPSLSHRIDWVFLREDMPLQITAEYGHWRRVVDRDGLGGWVHYSLLSGSRTVIVDRDLQPLFARADDGAPQSVLLEAGVIARVEECAADWCRLSAGGYRGWAPKAALWGVAPGEVLD